MQEQRDPNAYDGDFNSMPESENTGRRVFIETYGCQMNLADSELMGGILTRKGFTAADGLEDADVILINTCAVRERAEERVFGRLTQLLRFKHDKPDLVLGVTGCMAKHLEEKIVTRAPYVDLVVGPDAYRRLPDLLAEQVGHTTDPGIDVKLDRQETYEGLKPLRKPGVNGWVTVQRGCDKFCTFCIVPFVRGRERGVPPEDIIAQVQELADRGFKEVTLLGQTVNSYKYALESGEVFDFADLLEALVPIEGIERIRFTSPYPIDFTTKLIQTMARHDKICKYLHLPVQSGADSMLTRMRRGYTRAEYDALVAELREAMPEVAISTDIIVGFPGETEEEYQATVELLKEVRYDFAFLFKYSERSGTYAARKLDDDIPESLKKERLSEIIALQERISAETFRSRIGREYDIMVEGPSRRDPSEWCGRTDDFKTVVYPRDPARPAEAGDIIRVRINDCTSHTLRGERV